MRFDLGRVGRLLLPLLLTAGGCGDGASTLHDVRAAFRGVGAPANTIVVRYDFDLDDYDDVVTLDVSEHPGRVVEALQGLANGVFVDASARWGGQAIEADLDALLRAYLERSFAVASETQLETQVGGRPVLISVIE